MWSWIKWAVGVREKPEEATITPNSMSPLPKRKFINYARDINDNDDDKEPHKNIYEFKNWERKSLKQKQQMKSYFDFEKYFDKLNHS